MSCSPWSISQRLSSMQHRWCAAVTHVAHMLTAMLMVNCNRHCESDCDHDGVVSHAQAAGGGVRWLEWWLQQLTAMVAATVAAWLHAATPWQWWLLPAPSVVGVRDYCQWRRWCSLWFCWWFAGGLLVVSPGDVSVCAFAHTLCACVCLSVHLCSVHAPICAHDCPSTCQFWSVRALNVLGAVRGV